MRFKVFNVQTGPQKAISSPNAYLLALLFFFYPTLTAKI